MAANENEATQPVGVAPPADPAQTDHPEQLREQIGQTGGGPGDIERVTNSLPAIAGAAAAGFVLGRLTKRS